MEDLIKTEIFTAGPGPAVLFFTSGEVHEDAKRLFDLIKDQAGGSGFTLIKVSVPDWNACLSPWEYDLPGVGSFSGKGPDTLSHVINHIIPEYGLTGDIYTAGYSLAGLFSLWCIYESDVFSGCACCSGSLWYGGWDSYVKTHGVKNTSRVYLSIGGKEAQTKNTVMAAIADRTKEQLAALRSDKNVYDSVLEMNKGGHFADSVPRLAKGIVHLITPSPRQKIC